MLCCRYFGHGEWFAPTFAPPSAPVPAVMSERYAVPFVARELSEPQRPQTNEPQPPQCCQTWDGDGLLHVPQVENITGDPADPGSTAPVGPVEAWHDSTQRVYISSVALTRRPVRAEALGALRAPLLHPRRLLVLALCTLVSLIPLVMAAGQQIHRRQPQAHAHHWRRILILEDNTIDRRLDGFDHFAVTAYYVSSALALAFVLLQLLIVPQHLPRFAAPSPCAPDGDGPSTPRPGRWAYAFLRSLQLTGHRFWLRYGTMEAFSLAVQAYRLALYGGTQLLPPAPARVAAQPVVAAQAALLAVDLLLCCVAYVLNLRMWAIGMQVCLCGGRPFCGRRHYNSLLTHRGLPVQATQGRGKKGLRRGEGGGVWAPGRRGRAANRGSCWGTISSCRRTNARARAELT